MTRRSRAGGVPRSLDVLLSDFGTDLPRRPTPEAAPSIEKLFPAVVPARGRRAIGHGWAPTLPPLAGYELTSEQTPVMWPLIAGEGLPPTGAPMGFNVLSGGSFYCDPMGWVNDESIAVTNPNVFIFGKPGRGKSALVKAFMLRMIRFGYRSLVLGDVKDEYEDISVALGVTPYRIGPGLCGRINPLDFGPLAQDWEKQDRAETARRGAVLFNRWLALIRGLTGSQGVP
ncbi:MAG: ATP-binding protein, partial [Aquihabitans sp.]